MTMTIDTPPAHHYDIGGLQIENRQEIQLYADGNAVPYFKSEVPTPDLSLISASDISISSSRLTDDELVASWEAEQRELLLDSDFISIIDEITTYAATNPLLKTTDDQINWSLEIFGRILHKVLPSQIIVKNYTTLMIKLIEIAYSKNRMKIESKKKWVFSQFEIFAYMLYKNATTTEKFQERASVISGAEALLDPLLAVDLINCLSEQEDDLINSGDYHPLLHKIITHAANQSPLNIPEDQRNWSLLIFGEVLNNVIQQDQIKINDYSSLLLKLMEVAASNPLLKRGSSKKEWVLDQFEMIFDTLYKDSTIEDLAKKQDYIDAAGSIIDAAKAMYNQYANLPDPISVQGRRSAYFTAQSSPPSSLPLSDHFSTTPLVLESKLLTNLSVFIQETIKQITPDVINQLKATSTNLTESLSGPNRLKNLAPIITDILKSIPSLPPFDSTSVIAFEIGIIEGVLTVSLPLIPGGIAYLPVVLPLVPFAVKAINLAARELFDLGKAVINKIENKSFSML